MPHNLAIIECDAQKSVFGEMPNAQSDVDILVELDKSMGFFEFFQIKYYLEYLLKCPVDLGAFDALKEHLK